MQISIAPCFQGYNDKIPVYGKLGVAMGKKAILAQVNFDPEVDYEEVAKEFSKFAGVRVWFERDRTQVTVWTDGDPRQVGLLILKGVRHKMEEEMIDEVVADVLFFELSGMAKWEEKAPLN